MSLVGEGQADRQLLSRLLHRDLIRSIALRIYQSGVTIGLAEIGHRLSLKVPVLNFWQLIRVVN